MGPDYTQKGTERRFILRVEAELSLTQKYHISLILRIYHNVCYHKPCALVQSDGEEALLLGLGDGLFVVCDIALEALLLVVGILIRVGIARSLNRKGD